MLEVNKAKETKIKNLSKISNLAFFIIPQNKTPSM